MSASPSDMPSQLDAPHPEFGYLAPTTRFRRKITLTLKAAVLGGLAGAAAMFFMTADREEKPLTMLATPMLVSPVASTPTPAAPAEATPAPPVPVSAPSRPGRTAAKDLAAPPVPYVPESMALPAAAPRELGLRGGIPSSPHATAASGPATSGASTVGASAAADAVAAEPAAPATKAAAKPRKKIARERAPPEPDPRHAFARRFPLPVFGFGW